MPVHNGAETLAGALRSVWSQTDEDYELIVVDDASTDGTEAVLASQSDPRLRVVRLDRNVGQARATSAAVRKACGRYIKFLHADDRLHPDCVRAMADVLDESGSVGFVCSGRRLVFGEMDAEDASIWANDYGNLHRFWARPLDGSLSGPMLVREYLRYVLAHRAPTNWFAEPSGVMVGREILQQVGGMHLWANFSVDSEWWLRIALATDVRILNEELYEYRRDLTGVTATAVRTGGAWLFPLWLSESMLLVGDSEIRSLARRLRRRRLAWSVLSIGKAATQGEMRTTMSRGRLLARYAAVKTAVMTGRSRYFDPI